jgi:hypothetical protein
VRKEGKNNSHRGKKKMQPHNGDDQRSSEITTDGGRDSEWSALEIAAGVALAKVLNAHNRQVHIAEAGKPVNLEANVLGIGGLLA